MTRRTIPMTRVNALVQKVDDDTTIEIERYIQEQLFMMTTSTSCDNPSSY